MGFLVESFVAGVTFGIGSVLGIFLGVSAATGLVWLALKIVSVSKEGI